MAMAKDELFIGSGQAAAFGSSPALPYPQAPFLRNMVEDSDNIGTFTKHQLGATDRPSNCEDLDERR